MHDRGYGRKRRRVGLVFETAEEAAKAYAVECRQVLLDEVAAEKEAEAEREGLRAEIVAAAAREKLLEHQLEQGGSRDERMEEPVPAEDEYEVEAILAERVATAPGRGECCACMKRQCNDRATTV